MGGAQRGGYALRLELRRSGVFTQWATLAGLDMSSKPTPAEGESHQHRAQELNRIARNLFIAWFVGSIPYLLFTCTVGLISGLIVVLVPFYALCAQSVAVVVVVSLCAARQRFVLARGAGIFLSGTPGLGLVSWYVREWRECADLDDPAACFAYLNGGPLMPLGVGLVAVLSALAVSAVLLWIWREAHGSRLRVEVA